MYFYTQPKIGLNKEENEILSVETTFAIYNHEILNTNLYVCCLHCELWTVQFGSYYVQVPFKLLKLYVFILLFIIVGVFYFNISFNGVKKYEKFESKWIQYSSQHTEEI